MKTGDREQAKTLMRNLLLLPLEVKNSKEFDDIEQDLSSKLNSILLDPYWSDYLFYPSKYGLEDCLVETEGDALIIDERALDLVVKKIFEYKPIILPDMSGD